MGCQSKDTLKWAVREKIIDDLASKACVREKFNRRNNERYNKGFSKKNTTRRRLAAVLECEGQGSGLCWDPLCKHDPASTKRIPLTCPQRFIYTIKSTIRYT